jgi:uncharacterized membrane protein
MNIKTIITSGIIIIVLDILFLYFSSTFFNKLIKKIQGNKIKLKLNGVLLCYFFMILSINYFILSQNKSVTEAFILGLCIYGIYETTNYAIFDNWNIKALILDTLWGGILYASTTYIVNILNI